MGRRDGAFVVETLQDNLEAGNICTLFCRCHHWRVVPIEGLIEVFGPDLNISANRDYFLSRFKCEKCGERPMTVHITPGDVPKGW